METDRPLTPPISERFDLAAGLLGPGLTYRDFLQSAASPRRESAWRSSPFFLQHGRALEHLLSTPVICPAVAAAVDSQTASKIPSGAGSKADRPVDDSTVVVKTSAAAGSRAVSEGSDNAGGAPPGGAFDESRVDNLDRAAGFPCLRVAHWNIEKGKALAGLQWALSQRPNLRESDVLLLNEVDVGMARSANADTGRVLAQTHGGRLIFVPGYVECTKGLDDDLLAPGENLLGLHGLAIITRLPVRDVAVTLLPGCFDYFGFREKRFGYRQGLYALLEWDGQPLIVGTTHLEVRNTPRCRARQFARFLEGLREVRSRWSREAPVIVSGDWNTNSFRRGSFTSAAREFVRIVRTPPAELDAELVRPYRTEPLLRLLAPEGLELEPFNDRSPTAHQDLGTVEDLASLPPALGAALVRRCGLQGRVLGMRLDWIAASRLRAAAPPWTETGLIFDGRRVSDHAPIGVTLTRPEPEPEPEREPEREPEPDLPLDRA